MPFDRAADAPGQLGHDAFRVHAAGQHMAVVAITGDDLVAILQAGLHAGDDGFLSDIEVAETRDLAHAVELAGFLLEPPDEEHVAVVFENFVFTRFGGCLF